MSYENMVMEVYEAAANPEYFHELGGRICEFVRGGRAHFLLADMKSRTEYLSDLSGEQDDFSDEYNNNYFSRDFRVPRVLSLQRGVFTDERAYVSAHESRSSDIHQELLARYDIQHISGANLSTGGATGWFGISTRAQGEFFDADVVHALSGLTAHLHRAYGIVKANSDIMLDRRLMTAAMDSVGAGILLVRNRRVILANQMMQDMLARDFFHLSGGTLRCLDPAGSRRLYMLQRQPEALQTEPVMIRDMRTGESYAVSVRCPFPQFGGNGLVSGDELVITIRPLAASTVPARELIDAFCREHRLTRREADVVYAVLAGISLRSHAVDRGLKIDTVRKQLKSAMARLGIASQKDLFRLSERYQLTC